MTAKNLCFLILVGIFLLSETSCVSSKTSHTTDSNQLIIYSKKPPSSKSGSCYSKYTAQDVYKVDQTEYAIFTGNNPKDNENIETKTIILTPKKSKWVKKKKSPDCVSDNPHECYVACYEEYPAITRDIKIVKDTNLVRNFKLEKINQANLVQKGGAEGWIRTVCSNSLTPKYVKTLQTALQTAGFYDGKIDGVLTIVTREGLKAYQSSQNLIVGYLDMESMRSLGL